jgi:formiminoglutamate deiminase
MGALFFDEALIESGWASNVRICISGSAIGSVEVDSRLVSDDERHAIGLPGMPNLHSHAFQRGMAGLTEFKVCEELGTGSVRACEDIGISSGPGPVPIFSQTLRGPDQDSFWTWREVMYHFALALTPEDVQAIAALAYVEMLESGFTRVGEFQYLHHDREGAPFSNPAEMAEKIVAAASETGIGLTLLPVFYAHSDFGGKPPTPSQRRFICDAAAFSRLVEASRRAAAPHPGSVVGIAPHSLRATTPDEFAAIRPLAAHGPIHIHVAEQRREVEDCLAWSGRRPVEWLLEHAAPDGHWCFIHATHMTQEETRLLAEAGVVAGLCPLTEANLGDGIFNGPDFAACGGRFGIGTDSNVQVGLAEELRQLEYAQRLHCGRRNVMAGAGASTGRTLLEAAARGGSAALGAPSAALARGAPADIVSLDSDNPALIERHGDRVLDAWIFAARAPAVDCVWVRGRKWVEGGRHRVREPIAARYRRSIGRVLAAL